MLHIKIVNDSTGTQDSANYYYDVYINTKRIASGEIEGHDRSDGWEKLVEKLLDVERKEDK